MEVAARCVMELGICRSGREGGSSGSVIFGNGKLRDRRGATSFQGDPSMLHLYQALAEKERRLISERT